MSAGRCPGPARERVAVSGIEVTELALGTVERDLHGREAGGFVAVELVEGGFVAVELVEGGFVAVELVEGGLDAGVDGSPDSQPGASAIVSGKSSSQYRSEGFINVSFS